MIVAGYHPPSSKSVVNLPDSLVERYVAAGWTPVDKKETEDEKPRPVKRSPRKKQS